MIYKCILGTDSSNCEALIAKLRVATERLRSDNQNHVYRTNRNTIPAILYSMTQTHTQKHTQTVKQNSHKISSNQSSTIIQITYLKMRGTIHIDMQLIETCANEHKIIPLEKFGILRGDLSSLHLEESSVSQGEIKFGDSSKGIKSVFPTLGDGKQSEES